MKKRFLFLAAVFLFSSALFAQDKDLSVTYSTQDYPQLGPDKTTNVPAPVQVSPEVAALQKQMEQARISGDDAKVLEIQKQIDSLTGSSVTVPAGKQTGTVGNAVGQ